MLSRVSQRTIHRCTLCGSRLSAVASEPPAAAAMRSSRGTVSAGQERRMSTFRVPRWATSSAYSTASSAGPSTRTLRLAAVDAAKWRRRTYATIVETPTASEEDLPEPVIAQGKETADTTLNVTAAAEKQLARIQERESDPNLALRILVESGGCHGYSTKLHVADVTKDRQEDDYVLAAKSAESEPAVRPGLLLIDALTLSLIRGSTLDYATELIGSSFRLVDNPQAKGAGCGCGVSWELKI